jgi:hypothetical protein
MEKQAEREALAKQKEDDEAFRRQLTLETKERQRLALEQQRRNAEDKIRNEANSVKQEKQQ